jgi:hypothetical protein
MLVEILEAIFRWIGKDMPDPIDYPQDYMG